MESHLYIQSLLNKFSGKEEDDLEEFAGKLCALLAKNPEQQRDFYRLFGEYLELHSYQGKKEEKEPKKRPKRKIGFV